MISCGTDWLSKRVGVLNTYKLCEMFNDIHTYHSTGVLAADSEMRVIAEEFEREISCNYDLRLVENAILYEMARRLYNHCEGNNTKNV